MSLATDAREAIHHEYYRRWIVSVRGLTHGRPDAAPPRPLKAARRSLPLRAARTIVAVPALSMTPIRDRKVAFGRAALALRPAVAGTPTALAPPTEAGRLAGCRPRALRCGRVLGAFAGRPLPLAAARCCQPFGRAGSSTASRRAHAESPLIPSALACRPFSLSQASRNRKAIRPLGRTTPKDLSIYKGRLPVIPRGCAAVAQLRQRYPAGRTA